MHYKITIDFSDKNSSFMSPTITSTASTDSPSSSIVDQCHRSNMPDLVPHHPYYYHHHAQWVKNLWKIAKYWVSQDKLKLISFFSLALPFRYWKKKSFFLNFSISRTLCNETSAISAKDKATEVEISKRPPPPSHLRDALVKEDEENLDDNVEKPPKRKKGSKPREIIKPDPKYKGKLFDNYV